MKRILLPFVVLLALNGCAVRELAVNSFGDAVAQGGSAFSGDDDPELVRAAAPFSLKLIESLLAETPAHKGLLILSATIRNRATIALAYPHLELTLSDSNDQTVVKRALAPAEYASGTAQIAAGIPANGEVLVKLFIDASATSQAGYRLYLFYP